MWPCVNTPAPSTLIAASHTLVRPPLRLLLAGCMALLLAAMAAAKPISPYGLPGTASPGQAANATPPAPAVSDDLPLGLPQFNTTVIPLPPSATSLGYHSTGTSEFGDLVRLSGAAHYIDCVTLTLASWAIRSDYPGSQPYGFTHPITLRIYAVDRATGVPKPGEVLASVTRSFLIPWRPEPEAGNTSPLRPWRSADGGLYAGLAFNATFDLGSLARSLPDEVIFGISFNTQNAGSEPLRVPGPYNALHLALTDQSPSPGADVEPDAVFWQTTQTANYAGGLVAGNALRRDTGWQGRKPAIRFTNSAYGTLLEASILLSKLGSTNPRNEASYADAEAFIAQALLRELWDGNNRLAPAYGRFAFNLMAAAVDELSAVIANQDPLSRESRYAIDLLLDVSEALAEISVGDAIIAAGSARRISRAQGALEKALNDEVHAHFADAVDHFGSSWREAQSAMR